MEAVRHPSSLVPGSLSTRFTPLCRPAMLWRLREALIRCYWVVPSRSPQQDDASATGCPVADAPHAGRALLTARLAATKPRTALYPWRGGANPLHEEVDNHAWRFEARPEHGIVVIVGRYWRRRPRCRLRSSLSADSEIANGAPRHRDPRASARCRSYRSPTRRAAGVLLSLTAWLCTLSRRRDAALPRASSPCPGTGPRY